VKVDDLMKWIPFRFVDSGPRKVVQALPDGTPLDFIVDTGNSVNTGRWFRFSNDFAPRIKQEGTKSSKQIFEVGGSSHRHMGLDGGLAE
jgi:hypothetical protein